MQQESRMKHGNNIYISMYLEWKYQTPQLVVTVTAIVKICKLYGYV